MAGLQRIELQGFKSIHDLNLELRPLNVLIGANGAGKSNLVSFFKMLTEAIAGRLQQYIATHGRAQSLLHYGPRTTREIKVSLHAGTDDEPVQYAMQLRYAEGDTLILEWEGITYVTQGEGTRKTQVALGQGHLESRLSQGVDAGVDSAKLFHSLMECCRIYHFHDTSGTAQMRQYCYIGDDRWLSPYAGNLAAMLYRFREFERGPAYRRILGAIRQVAPFFGDFVLEPTGPDRKEIILNWREKDSDHVFGPHQLSDGTLRLIALFTLLLQPPDLMPGIIIIDEPELGLHPSAKNLLAGMLRSASHHSQIIVATQSPELVDSFDPEDVIVVERQANGSVFRRLDSTSLKDWLDDYTLGELWEKNVIGGGPFSEATVPDR